jgi:hypothetical protein
MHMKGRTTFPFVSNTAGGFFARPITKSNTVTATAIERDSKLFTTVLSGGHISQV